ncbi:AraC family transcriptional regulator [Leptolyngbya sp. FACHB-17]|uniref:helix-turn-helix transcriptional regulator n=1 Tax=unclassified Leptolyngbya TaxID=2650499 RepID=UPI00168181DB|nr:AraC family transcriptional regulator [Leptolyngbya sp. FACHB-17]MBD2078966.1 helix-turn-helix transcriptional regulator [Leptolyngbya sp. FACHB-17]
MTLFIAADDVPLISPSTRELHLDNPESGKIYRWDSDVCDGLNLLIDDYQLGEHLVLEYPACDNSISEPELELSFCLIGTNRDEGVRAGQNFFSACWSTFEGGMRQWQKGDRIFKFDIHFSSAFLHRLVEDDFGLLPADLVKVLHQPSDQEFCQIGETKSVMRSILRQILECPYQGVTRRVYLEAKAIELIALRLATLGEALQPTPTLQLKSDEIDRIYWARDILIEHLSNPPSLLALARQVGLNDHKLKTGFRACFGTTVFGYLQVERMELARSLLIDSAMRVKDVAEAVGYRKASQFAEVFKRQFGISPKEYQQQYGIVSMIC